jgi:hypothetical protein
MSVNATRLHTVGAILFALTGIAHTIGQFLPSRLDPGSAAVETAMKEFVIPDSSFTYWNIMQCWGALYGGMTFLFGIGLLAAARAAGGEPRVLRATAAVGAIAAALQAAVALVYHTPPPAFFMVPASLVMVAAGIAAGRRPA